MAAVSDHMDSEAGHDEEPLVPAGARGVQEAPSTRRSWVRKAGAGALAGALLLLAPAAVHLARQPAQQADLSGAEMKNAVDVVAPRESCSANGDNCLSSKCCQTSGSKCFKKDNSWADCRPTCPSGWDCTEQKPWWTNKPVVYRSGTSLYCFTVFVKATKDPSKPNHQLELLQAQFKFKSSIFGCGDWEVFSDVDAELAKGVNAVKVLDVDGEFTKLSRWDKPYKYVNTPVFVQVWKAIRDHGKYQGKDYTVKVDPYTVFIPSRLIGFLSNQAQTEHGDYYENCQGVDSGFFGNIEVANLKAMTVFLTNIEDCKLSLCWQSTDDCKKDWKYGPWGEDLFMQRCMDHHGVEKLTGFELTTSGSCPTNRPVDQKDNQNYVPSCHGVMTPAVHPFKTPQDWFGCLGAITGQTYA